MLTIILCMNGNTTQGLTDQSSTPRLEVTEGLRRIKVGSLTGMVSQTIVWSSVISLLMTGSILSHIPVAATITYGANTFTISAGEIFAINYLLVLGVIITLVSFVYYLQGFKRVAGTIPYFDDIVFMTLLGVVGSGMFATGWALWLGSFIGPGTGYSSGFYTSQMSDNIGVVVWLLLFIGGVLILLGMMGMAVGNHKIGLAYQERDSEFGGMLSAFPIISVIGQLLCLVGSLKSESKIAAGWSPPPPPQVPPQVMHRPAMTYQNAYPPGTTIIVSGEQRSPDPLAAVLAVILVLMWIVILPTFLYSISGGYLHGTGGPPSSSGQGTSSSSGVSVLPFLGLFIGIIVTVVLLTLIVVRRRKGPNQQPPPPPTPPPKQEDLLDHLV